MENSEHTHPPSTTPLQQRLLELSARVQAFQQELPEDEALLAIQMVGGWFSSKARSVNEGLVSSEVGSKEYLTQAEEAKSLLSEFCQLAHAISEDAFERFAVQGIGFSLNEAEELAQEVSELRDYAEQVAQPLARDITSTAGFSKLRESAEFRRETLRREEARKDKKLARLEAETLYAPLMECVASYAKRSLRAELAVKMEMYIESGHAERDIFSTSSSEGLACQDMQNLAKMIRNGQRPEKDALDVLNRRFAELFLDVRIVQEVGIHGDTLSRAELTSSTASKRTKAEGALEAARSGYVDAVIRDARDPSTLHMAVVTVDETTFVESDQAFRHFTALSNLVKTGGMEGVSSVKPSFYAPSLLYSNKERQGELGSSFINLFEGGLNEREREVVNCLPFLSMMARVGRVNDNFPVECLAEYDLRLIGARSNAWREVMSPVAALHPGADKRGAFLSAAESLLSEASQLIGTIEREIPTANTCRVPLVCLVEGIEGLHAHGTFYPEVLERFGSQAIPSLEKAHARMAGDGNAAARFEAVLSHHDPLCGGVAAYVQSSMERALRVQERREKTEITHQLLNQASHITPTHALSLIARGADLTFRNSAGQDACEVAKSAGNQAAADVMGRAKEAQALREARRAALEELRACRPGQQPALTQGVRTS